MIKLTEREEQVLSLYVQKGRLKAVAAALNLSPHTVRVQKNSIMRKLGETTNIGLVRAAIQKGLVKS